MNKPSPCSHVIVDPLPGIREAVRCLAELGHRDVLYILRKRADGSILTSDRFDAATNEADRHRLTLHQLSLPPPPGAVREAGDYISYYHHALLEHLPDPVKATAVFCYNDTMAAALYMVLQHRGVRVPDDVSVIGFDDTLAPQLLPPLSTIRQHYYEMGAEAVREAIAQFEKNDKDRKPEIIVLPSELVVRDSTGLA